MVRNIKRKDRLKQGLLKLGEVARKTGALPSTIRYYSNMGLIAVADYTQGKYRLFREGETVEAITRIRGLKRKGLTLDEIQKEIKNGV